MPSRSVLGKPAHISACHRALIPRSLYPPEYLCSSSMAAALQLFLFETWLALAVSSIISTVALIKSPLWPKAIPNLRTTHPQSSFGFLMMPWNQCQWWNTKITTAAPSVDPLSNPSGITPQSLVNPLYLVLLAQSSPRAIKKCAQCKHLTFLLVAWSCGKSWLSPTQNKTVPAVSPPVPPTHHTQSSLASWAQWWSKTSRHCENHWL